MADGLTSLNNQIYLSNDKEHLLLMAIPLDETVSAAELTDIVSHSEYSALKINPQGIKLAINALAKLHNAESSPPDLKPIVIADRVNAQLNVSIDPLKLNVKAEIISAYGGKSITLDQIAEDMKALDVSFGISKKMLHLLTQKSKKAPPGKLYQGIVAKGEKPINGYNASFECLVETPSERVMQPQMQENGKVDMRDLGDLVAVKPGTPLMRKIPHLEGSPGLTVTNEPIKFTEGKDVSLNIGDNTELDPNDDHLLLATLAGIPYKINNGMRVDNALMIDNVDVSFGHVNYEGDVIISGDIRDGMKINATGNITVAGFIESAHVVCAGDLIVGKGILGRKRTAEEEQFSCQIDCKGSVTATFSQYSKINVEKDLTIKNQLLHCMVICRGHISVKNDSGNKGVALGGLLSAYKGMSAVVIGSPAGTKTLIDITGSYPELIEIKNRIEDNIAQEQAKLHSVAETQELIASAPLTKKRKEVNARLEIIQEEAHNKLLTLANEQEANVVAIQKHFNDSKVVTFKKLYGQVSISSGDSVFNSQSSSGATCVSIEESKLIAGPYQP